MKFKKFDLNSIRSKLIASLILICVIPLIVEGAFSYNQSKSILNNKLNLTSTQMLNEVNSGLVDYFHGFNDMVALTAGNYDLVNVDEGNNFSFVLGLLKDLQNSNKDILDAYYGTASGKFSISTEAKMPEGYDATKRPWYMEAVKNSGKTIVTQPYKDVVTQGMVVGIARAVMKDGKVVGVVGVDCTLSTLADRISTKKIGNTGYVFISDKDGNIIAHPNKKIISTNEAAKLSFWDKAKTTDSDFVTYEYNGEKKFGVYQTNKLTGWKIVASLKNDELTNDTKSITLTTAILIGIMTLIAIGLSLLLSKGIDINIKKLRGVFEKASHGDLSNKIEIKTKDEFGDLAKDYNSMIKNIGILLENARKTSDTVLETTSNLSSMAEETNASMSQVAMAVSEISKGAVNLAETSGDSASSIGTLSEKLDDVSEVTKDMSNVSNDTKNLSKKGIDTVNVLISKNTETMDASIVVSNIVGDMDNSVREISTISDAITDITDQTNLLALNASIEAARAGEAGKGFAVVAEEIRELAEQSKNSTEQIKSIIANIQEKASKAVKAIDNNKKIGLEQNEVVARTEEIFTDILMSIVTLVEKVDNVRISVEDMQVQKQIFVEQVENTSAISEETASSIEEVTASTEEVTETMDKFAQHTVEVQGLAERLKEEIYKFRV
ncbi:methyl-accepting chemotaxis protein [Clostridium felsineum]|uniref:Methyl-accepting chemotaxis protein McpC n=1 Tax=Clostridium felsineum TaxID=36839 RepID=A0A1S8L340_9CLOT|nr:methyl-accepting chemotaxis protein [Clostridium felsineum]URZ07460.1 Methyl-accepting chemotaxis protein McpC [Clostridium felsineum]URZ12491.1 Methyl-accepting chemotaxis protein McpC [Clostridium felsineum]